MGGVHNLFCMQLVYRKVTDLCALILYPVTLLNSFIISRSFLEEILGSLMSSMVSSANGDSVTYFPICIISNFFPCFITSTSSLRKMIKGNKNTGNLFLISEFGWVASNFFTFRMMLSVGFISFCFFPFF